MFLAPNAFRKDNNNMAKTFYKLLVENKNLPVDNHDSPKVIDKKVLRRRSVAAPARAAQVGVTADPTIIKAHPDVKRSSKRSSQRSSVRLSERPIRSEKSRQRSDSIGQKDDIIHTKEADSESKTPATPNNGSPMVKTTTTKNVVWGISPSQEPESKVYQVGTNQNVTQILEALRNCFNDIGPFDISTKQTKSGIKVKARRSGKRHGSPVVKMNLKQKEGDLTEITIKGGGGKTKEEFKELAKKVEETLVV